jgi:hypothetical protein
VGRRGAFNGTETAQAESVPLSTFLGRESAGNRTEASLDFLSILSDPEYMAGVKEKLNLIAAYGTNPQLVAA